MNIDLKLHGILRDYLPREAKGRTTLSLPPGSTVADVVQKLAIKQTANGSINGVQVELSHPLQEGDELHLFKQVGGG